MKSTPRSLMALVLMAVVTAAGLWAQGTNQAAALLEAAIQEEVVDGNLTGAIAHYEAILARFSDERAVAVQALWHLGQCYERRGDSRTRQTYERLMQPQYAEFGGLVSAARVRLVALVETPEDAETSEVAVEGERRSTAQAALAPETVGNQNFVIFSDLAVHDVRTGLSRRLTDGARSAAYPVLSPDNRQVAYLSWSGDLQESLRQVRAGHAGLRATAELRTVDMNGENDRVLLKRDDVPWLRPFAWSPDGGQILTVLERVNGARQISLIDTKDGSTRTLRSLQTLSPQAMSYSSDGRYIAYEVATPRNSRELEFFILPVDGPPQAPLIERRYSLSLDGQRGGVISPDQSIIHVLNRAGFGPRLGDIERVKAMGIDAYIEQQLHPEKIPDPVVDAKLRNFTSLTMPIPQLLEKSGPVVLEGLRRRATLFESREMADRKAKAEPGSAAIVPVASDPPGNAYVGRPSDLEVQSARIVRAVYSERQLQEVMVDFWMNHFNVNMGGTQIAPDFENAIRRNTFGSFEELLFAVARHPVMLFYLDNWKSSAPADVIQQRIAAIKATGDVAQYLPVLERMGSEKDVKFSLRDAKGLNENYARELMELHTLGVDGGYTQKDIVEVAKILTGWTISRKGIANAHEEDGVFAFDPLMHVDGDKIVLGQTIKSGGMDEAQQLLKMLAHHPSTARFIATKLARRFIADDPPEAAIDAAARTFLQTGGNIREVVKTILMSPQFRSADAYHAKIKKPLELVVSAMRAVGAELADGETTDLVDQINATFLNRRGGILSQMGELLYTYEAPDGNPDVGAAWINSNALLVRLEFANNLAAGKVRGVKVNLASARLMLDQLGMPKPTPSQVEQTRAMLQKQPGPTSAAPYAAAQMMMMAPGGAAAGAAAATVVDPATIIVATMLGSPQFQKR